jgi:penicillin-binding protein 1A
MDRAKRRQTYVLQQMADKGFITRKDADEAIAQADRPEARRHEVNSAAPYFLEEVRKELEGRYGAKALYQNGLTVQTALDLKLQDAANRALDEGVRRVDHIHGFRKPRRNVLDEKHTVEGFKAPALGSPVRRQRHHPGAGRRPGRVRHPAPRGGLSRDDRQERVRVDAEGPSRRSSSAAVTSSKEDC